MDFNNERLTVSFYFFICVVFLMKYCDREEKIDLEIFAGSHVPPRPMRRLSICTYVSMCASLSPGGLDGCYSYSVFEIGTW